MSYPHTRQLGAQSGVQLNPLADNTDGFAADNSDQMAAVIGRFRRGRIDAPFKVSRGNFQSKLGLAESLRVSALNEAYVQGKEAADNGVYELVVQRLSVTAAQLKYVVFKIDADGEVSSWTVATQPPTSDFLFYIKDLECFNDGTHWQLTAEAVGGNAPEAAKIVTLRALEPDGTLRWEFTGSLDKAAVDEYNQDNYLGTKIATQTDLLEIEVAANAAIPTTADCYGTDDTGAPKVSKTEQPLVLFVEGGTGYQVADYDRAIAALENNTLDFGYIFSAGSEAVALLAKIAQFVIRANRHLVLDVPGDLTPDAAKTFIEQLNLDTHYVSTYWAPLQTDDPVNGGKAIIGTSGYQTGLRCARNARTNSYGLAPKNYPIAGKDWPLNRTGVKQLVTPSEPQLNMLAKAKINPVIFETYQSGGRYVFRDSLTCAKTDVSARKLISVAEMSASFDDMVAKYGKELLQQPMDVAIKKMGEFLSQTMANMRASGWLVASAELGEKGWAFSVERNAVRPNDRMDVKTWAHYDGVNRATFIQQTLSR